MVQRRIAIELDETLAARLEAAAERAEMSAETLAARAVARAVAEYERTGEAIPLASMEAWVKSWGTASEAPPPEPCKSSS